MKTQKLAIGVVACVLALAGTTGAAHAAGYYKCKTVGGRIVISDRPCTQESLGTEGLKLATPPPAAAQPPETSPHDSAYSMAGPRERKAAVVDAEAFEAQPARGQPDGIKRQEEAERQSGLSDGK